MNIAERFLGYMKEDILSTMQVLKCLDSSQFGHKIHIFTYNNLLLYATLQ